MKRKILIGVGVVVALVVVAAVVVLGQLGRLIERGVETAGPPITGTEVSLGSAHVSIFDGAGALNRLRIGNPKGFSDDDAFDLGKIAIVIDPKSVASDVVHVRSIVIDAPTLLAEFDAGGRSNLNAILDHVKAASGKPTGAGGGSGGKEKRLIVDEFRFANAEVRALAPAFQLDRKLKIPTIQLKNLGGKNGALPSEIASQVMRPVINAALQAAAGEYMKAKGGQAADKLLDKLFK
jgi:hypothetical protein